MNAQQTEYYIGTVKEVINSLTYEITLDIPGVILEATGVPFRGELDQPMPGDLILCHALDPVNKSVFLYQKLKENEFIGFRSNGKMVRVTPDALELCILKPELETYPDSYSPSDNDIKCRIQLTKDGVVNILEAEKINFESNGDINIKSNSGNISLSTPAGGVNVKSVSGTTLDGGLEVKNGILKAGKNPTGPFIVTGQCSTLVGGNSVIV